MSIEGADFLALFVEVFESTFGHDVAFVGAPRSSKSSDTEVLLDFAARVRLQSVTEKPGPLSDVSNVSE